MRKIIIDKHFRRIICNLLLIISGGVILHAQTPSEIRDLPANQTIEREMTGAQTHRYQFDLKSGDFFQVRVEQKGVDVQLKLLGADGKPLAEMDSPNGTEGFETLSFVAEKSGAFVLEVVNSNEKTENAKYIIKRQTSRIATEKDKRRVATERSFLEAMKSFNENPKKSIDIYKEALKGFRESGDSEMEEITSFYLDFQILRITSTEGNELFQNGQKMVAKGREKGSLETLNNAKENVLMAEIKFRESEKLVFDFLKNHPEFVKKLPSLKIQPYIAKQNLVTVASFLSTYYQFLVEPDQQLKYALIALEISQKANELDISETNIGEDEKLINELGVIQNLASAFKEQRNPEAVTYYEQFLIKYHRLKDLNSRFYSRDQEAGNYQILAYTYSELCRNSSSYCNQKVIENYNEAALLHK